MLHQSMKECNECNVRFVNKQSLKRHIEKVHEGKKPFMYYECKVEFGNKQSLNRHIETVHEGKKP